MFDARMPRNRSVETWKNFAKWSAMGLLQKSFGIELAD